MIMGNIISNNDYPDEKKKYFLIDRIIVANLNNISGNNIYIGVMRDSDGTNPLSNQGIRIGSSEISRLKKFIKADKILIYEFDLDIKLSVFQRNETDVCYNIETPSMNIKNIIDPIIRKNYKSINMSSNELDFLKTIIELK